MNWSDQSPQILGFSLLALWSMGFLLLLWGRRMKSSQASIAAIGLLSLFLILLSVDFFFLDRDFGGAQKIWSRGWIGPRELDGAITVGILEDPLGLAMTWIACAAGLVVAASRWLMARENSKENEFNAIRILSGTLLSVASVGMSWMSSTPWLSLLGLGMATLAGVVALGVNEDQEASEKISRFGRERTWGLLFAFLGTIVLAGQRAALGLDRSYVLQSQASGAFFDWAGGSLLVSGLYLYLQPFPFLGWIVNRREDPTTPGLLLNQILPALAAFAIALRFESELNSIGILVIFGGWALFSSFLAICSGLSQPSPRRALALVVSSGFSIAFAALCWGDPSAAILILISLVFSSFCLSYAGSMREAGFRHGAVQTLVVLSTLSAGGMIGFVGAGGFIRFLQALSADPVRAGVVGFVLLTYFLLLWKVCWATLRSEVSVSSDAFSERASSLVWAFFLVILSLGVFWTGTLSGGVIPHDPDQVMPSWLAVSVSHAFSAQAVDWSDDANITFIEGLYWALAVLAGLISFWMGSDRWLSLFGKSDGVREFFQTGYQLDFLGGKISRALMVTGAWIEQFLGVKISSRWIPSLFATVIRVPAVWIDRVDQRLYKKSGSLLHRSVDIPGKLLQLIQNGDLQWYLFFAIGCAFAVLIHFLRA